MIIKGLLRLHSSLAKSYITLSSYQLSSVNKNQLTTEIRADLIEKLEKMNIRTSKSIFIQQQLPNQSLIQSQTAQTKEKKKKNKYQFKILTAQQKNELGLMIPKSPFNLRMTRQSQQLYRQKICQDLYEMQKQSLNTHVRILQLQNANINVDQYINSTYKDIFARFMISRGIGIQWEANHSSYGVLNPKQKAHSSKQIQLKQFYQWVTSLMQEYPIGKKQVIGVYSYSQGKYIGTDNFDVENVYKIGYFFKLNLTKFGKFQDSFKIASSKGQKIQLLVMVEDPAKLLNIQAICIQPNKKMIILSKFQNSSLQQTEIVGNTQYLITSMDVYTDHKQYFTQNGYTKHLLFQSKHLLEMEAQDGIKIVQQIEGYQRKGGAYIIDRYSGLPDFQRAQQYELPMKKVYLDENGKVINNDIDQKDRLSIIDPKFSQKLFNNLQKNNIKAKQIDLYSTYQDQIYSHDNQKLHFRVTHNYIIPIPESHKQQLQTILQKSIVSQSKVQVPKLNRYYPKPRDKRAHKKEIKRLLEQQTQYMSLSVSLQSIDQLAFSTIHNQNSNYILPIFVRKSEDNINGQNTDGSVLMNNKIKQILKQSLLITRSESQNVEQLQIKWDTDKLKTYLKSLNSQLNINHNNKNTNKNKIKIELKFIPLAANLLKAFQAFRNYSLQPQLSNVVIEPQSKTQDVVPYFFHLHLMIHKMYIKQNTQKQKGRRTKQNINNIYNNININNNLFSLVKFHPTIQQSQRNRKVDEILFGVAKANNQQQYGYGLQALRLWIARNDSYLGDRKLTDKDVNKQLQLSAFIRKLYWQILPLMNIDLDKIIITNPQNQIQLINNSNIKIDRQKLSYLHRFMIDHINYYIINMKQCYQKLQLNKAIQLTQDFFKNYIHQIFVKTIRKRIIAYPLQQQTKQHIYVLNKILQLVSVIAPLLPYSAYHVSKVPSMKWPQINHDDIRSQLILGYNRMTKLRVEVRNKFIINSFYHSQLVIPVQKIMKQQQNIENQDETKKQTNQFKATEQHSKQNKQQTLPQIWRLSKQDLQLFFGIQNISLVQPTELGKCFKLKLTQQHPIGQMPHIKFYQYKQVCIRCSPTRNYGTHLCQKCLDYLNSNYGKKLPLIA